MRDVINKMGNFINQTNESMLIRIFDVTSIKRWLLDKISNYPENNYSSIKFQNYFLYTQKTKCYQNFSRKFLNDLYYILIE